MRVIVSVILFFVSVLLYAQETIPLYRNGKIPNSIPNDVKEDSLSFGRKGIAYRNVTRPTLTIFFPEKEKATGVGVIICPGGGYIMEMYGMEGELLAKEFVKRGIAVFLLKYRLPSDQTMKDKSIGPLQDAQQAIKIVRMRASEWNLDPGKIGMMGLSAGGHLASTAGTHFDKSYIPNEEKINLRPDFLLLVYPVISMEQEITHKGSRDSLLGEKPSEEQVEFFSTDIQVTENTPPTWLTQASNDSVVPVENSIWFYQALVKSKVYTGMNLIPKGNHGFFGVPVEEWMQPMFNWITNLKP